MRYLGNGATGRRVEVLIDDQGRLHGDGDAWVGGELKEVRE